MEYKFMEPVHTVQVAEMEKLYFSCPWSLNSITSELSNPLSLWLVAVDGDRVVGYVGSQSVIDEADMMNLAVRSEYRRNGIAQRLVEELICRLSLKGIKSLTLEVRASNQMAILLYQKLGFTRVGCRPNYYMAPKEDALILRKEWGSENPGN